MSRNRSFTLFRYFRPVIQSVSTLEVYPPQDRAKWKDLITSVSQSKFSHMQVSVVHKIPANTQDFSLNLAQYIPPRFIIPHIGVTSYKQSEFEALLAKYKQSSIQKLFLVRGDKPEYTNGKSMLSGHDTHTPPLSSSTQLTVLDAIKIARDIGFTVGATCHPEGHPLSPSINAQVKNAIQKQEAGCSYLVSQSVFHIPPLIAFHQIAKDSGLRIPLNVNIIPIDRPIALQRFIDQNKLTAPYKLIDCNEQQKHEHYAQLIRDLNELNYSIVFSSLNKMDYLKKLLSCPTSDVKTFKLA